MKLQSRTRSRSRFRRGLLVFTLVMLCAIAAALVFLWSALADYEANTPESSMRRYLDRVSAGEWDALAAESGFEPTEFATLDDYEAALKRLYAEPVTDPVFVRTGGGEADPVYTLKQNGEKVAVLALTRAPGGSEYKWNVRTDIEPLDPVTITAPAFARVSVNGKALGAPASSEAAPAFADLPEGYDAPQRSVYSVEGLLMPPEITAEADGVSCEVAQTEDGYDVTVRPAADAALWERAEAAARTYAAFITQDATRAQLNAYLLRGTAFYDAMQEFYNGWYIDHNAHEFRDMTHESIRMDSPDAFTAELSFTYVIRMGSKEYEYPSRYRLAFLNTADGWKAVQVETL